MQHSKLATIHASIYRTALNRPRINNEQEHMMTAQVLLDTEMLPLRIIQTVARPRYLRRMIHFAPPLIRVMVDLTWEAPKGWAQFLAGDYRWLRSHTDPSRRPEGPTPEDLVKFVRHHPRDFQALLRAAINKAQ
eukprot:4843022-Pyramimonas_sp.AAC.1